MIKVHHLYKKDGRMFRVEMGALAFGSQLEYVVFSDMNVGTTWMLPLSEFVEEFEEVKPIDHV